MNTDIFCHEFRYEAISAPPHTPPRRKCGPSVHRSCRWCNYMYMYLQVNAGHCGASVTKLHAYMYAEAPGRINQAVGVHCWDRHTPCLIHSRSRWHNVSYTLQVWQAVFFCGRLRYKLYHAVPMNCPGVRDVLDVRTTPETSW